MSLTGKQEQFVQAWVETGNKSEAYRRAYSTENMASTTITEKASRLSGQDNIRARYVELTGESQKRCNTTVDSLDEMLKQAFRVAKESDTPASMVSAVMGLAKLHGLDAETQQKLRGEGGEESMADVMRDVVGKLPD